MCAFAHVLACGKDGSCHTVAFLEFAFANSPILVCAFAHVLACGKDGKHGEAGPRKRGAQRRVRRLERKRNAGQPGFWLVSNQPKSRPYKKNQQSFAKTVFNSALNESVKTLSSFRKPLACAEPRTFSISVAFL